MVIGSICESQIRGHNCVQLSGQCLTFSLIGAAMNKPELKIQDEASLQTIRHLLEGRLCVPIESEGKIIEGVVHALGFAPGTDRLTAEISATNPNEEGGEGNVAATATIGLDGSVHVTKYALWRV